MAPGSGSFSRFISHKILQYSFATCLFCSTVLIHHLMCQHRCTLLLLLLLPAVISAFTLQPATFTPITTSHKCRQVRFMTNKNSNDDAQAEAERLREKARQLKEEVASLSGKSVQEMEQEESSKTATSSNTLYDDEVKPYKDPLSDNMRARLMKEASTGLDPNAKQTNVILYISIVVAVLVALGGSGILY